MKMYWDTEQERFWTFEELQEQYKKELESGELDPEYFYSFEVFLNNCLYENNGSLREVKGNDIWGQTEVCPECNTENFYYKFDPETEGYIVTCKHCGKKLFLCDACLHADDNPEGLCDWHRNETGRGCFRGWIEKGE